MHRSTLAISNWHFRSSGTSRKLMYIWHHVCLSRRPFIVAEVSHSFRSLQQVLVLSRLAANLGKSTDFHAGVLGIQSLSVWPNRCYLHVTQFRQLQMNVVVQHQNIAVICLRFIVQAGWSGRWKSNFRYLSWSRHSFGKLQLWLAHRIWQRGKRFELAFTYWCMARLGVALPMPYLVLM
jgi:hypothetical protein